MQIQPVADPEMVKRIQACVQNPELRSLLLKIVSDQRITQKNRARLSALFSGKPPRKAEHISGFGTGAKRL